MTSPINESGSLSASSPSAPTPSSALDELTPWQRMDGALAHLSQLGKGSNSVTTSNTGALMPPGAGELIAPLQRINEVMRSYGLEFTLNEHPSRVVTRIVDRASGDVIRQIPSEEVLQIAKRLDELQGRLINLEA